MIAPARAANATANRVIDDAVRRALFGSAPVVIVKSPPGAGKTFLVECATAVATAEPRMRVAIVTPGVSQAYDVAERLLDYDLPRLELVHALHRTTLRSRSCRSQAHSESSGPPPCVRRVERRPRERDSRPRRRHARGPAA